MRKAIFTIMIGKDPSYAVVRKSFEKYAHKVGADLICTTSLNYGELTKSRGFSQRHCAWFEKTRIKDLLEKYDRVLYLDADILITPHAPDIFAAYPETDTVYMLNEGPFADRQKTISQLLSLLPLEKAWPKNTYYNSGVMLISRNANFFHYINNDDLLNLAGKVSMYDQTYFNYLMLRHGLKTQSISQDFNRMSIFGTNNYLDGNFIHYAGGGYCEHMKLRYRTIINDYIKLYKDPSSTIQQSLVKLKSDLQFLSHQVMRNLSKPFT